MRFTRRQLILALLLALIPLAAAGLATSWFLHRSAAPMRLKVDLSERTLYVIQGGETVASYGVAVGRASNPTPTGTFRTGRIVWNPAWVPPPRDWARNMKRREGGDPRNPMQGVKIYFREPWYYIHGTNDPGSIGSAASRGCLRMRTADAVALARRISNAGGSVTLQIQR